MTTTEITSIFKKESYRAKGKNKYIITGAPGVGKTTLIEHVLHHGCLVFPEAARLVIQHYQHTHPEWMPWRNAQKFDELCLEFFMRAYHAHDSRQLAFFDRGLPDYIAWRWYRRLTIQDVIQYPLQYPYEQKIFFLPPWENIYKQDKERPFSFQQACAISAYIYSAYTALGYVPIMVPKATVEERMRFIQTTLQLHQ